MFLTLFLLQTALLLLSDSYHIQDIFQISSILTALFYVKKKLTINNECSINHDKLNFLKVLSKYHMFRCGKAPDYIIFSYESWTNQSAANFCNIHFQELTYTIVCILFQSPGYISWISIKTFQRGSFKLVCSSIHYLYKILLHLLFKFLVRFGHNMFTSICRPLKPHKLKVPCICQALQSRSARG